MRQRKWLINGAGKIDEARQNYETCLQTDPSGEFASAARQALTQTQANSVEHPK